MKRPIVPVSWCLVATVMLLATNNAVAQITIDKRITVQPIQVRSTDGTTSIANPSLTLFEAETDKIFSQAGIDVLFLTPITYNDSNFLNTKSDLSATSLAQLSQTSGQSWSHSNVGGNPANDLIVRLFFVQLIDSSSSNLGYTLQSTLTPDGFGNPNPNQNVFIAIADNAFTINRIDVIAHELGHALALDHTTQGAGGTLNFMSSPRTSPTFIGDIYPNGIGADQMIGSISVGNLDWQTDQIDRARTMPISVSGSYPAYVNPIPEPAATTVIASSLILATVGIIRRKQGNKLSGPN